MPGLSTTVERTLLYHNMRSWPPSFEPEVALLKRLISCTQSVFPNLVGLAPLVDLSDSVCTSYDISDLQCDGGEALTC